MISRGELLMVYNIVQKGSLWSNIVFEKEVISHSTIKRLKAWSPLLEIWKLTNLCNKSVFSFIILSQLRWPIESTFSQICYFMHMWDTNVHYYYYLVLIKLLCLTVNVRVFHVIHNALLDSRREDSSQRPFVGSAGFLSVGPRYLVVMVGVIHRHGNLLTCFHVLHWKTDEKGKVNNLRTFHKC